MMSASIIDPTRDAASRRRRLRISAWPASASRSAPGSLAYTIASLTSMARITIPHRHGGFHRRFGTVVVCASRTENRPPTTISVIIHFVKAASAVGEPKCRSAKAEYTYRAKNSHMGSGLPKYANLVSLATVTEMLDLGCVTAFLRCPRYGDPCAIERTAPCLRIEISF